MMAVYIAPLFPRLTKIWADAGNPRPELAAWCPRRGRLGTRTSWNMPLASVVSASSLANGWWNAHSP